MKNPIDSTFDKFKHYQRRVMFEQDRFHALIFSTPFEKQNDFLSSFSSKSKTSHFLLVKSSNFAFRFDRRRKEKVFLQIYFVLLNRRNKGNPLRVFIDRSRTKPFQTILFLLHSIQVHSFHVEFERFIFVLFQFVEKRKGQAFRADQPSLHSATI